jgi:hypothetical protein
MIKRLKDEQAVAARNILQKEGKARLDAASDRALKNNSLE